MRILNETELEGVLAHELSHVTNRDMLISTIAATLAGAITGVARMAYFTSFFGGARAEGGERGGNPLVLILFSIPAPLAALLIHLAVSPPPGVPADQSGA